MEVHCLYDRMAPVSKLKHHPKNHNQHSNEQILRLAQILKYQGWRYPIKVSKRSGFITSGHGRLEAALLNGWVSVPVNEQDYASDEQEYADVHSDNAIASWAELDLAGVNADLGDLGPDFNLDLLGIKDFVLEPADKFAPGCDEDEAPEPPMEPTTKRGDLYQLGRHRLLCGDATVITDVERLMGGERADMVFTDPPYGISLDTNYERFGGSNSQSRLARHHKKYRLITNDDRKLDPNLILELFGEAREVFMWGFNYYMQPSITHSVICWDKKTTESMDKMHSGDFELCWSMRKHKNTMCRLLWSGVLGHSRTDDGANKVHPTQKPVKLAQWFFERWGKPDDLVIDLFGGSGSTLIACEKTNRRCFMSEIDPAYCDVIVARWEKYSGQKADLLHGPA